MTNAVRWTTEDFMRQVGRKPEDDDLDRCNCCEAGQSQGHMSCGVCLHGLPVFMCHYCFVMQTLHQTLYQGINVVNL